MCTVQIPVTLILIAAVAGACVGWILSELYIGLKKPNGFVDTVRDK